MYPEQLVAPMRADLTTAGFQELKTPADVENSIKEQGTTLMVINSVCGCAAGAARPGIKWALENTSKKPAHLTTVFAGVDK
jgi:putative YphP/YqiW family bacilliredoxin